MKTLDYTPKDPAIAAELERRIAELDECIEDEGLALLRRVVADVYAESVSMNERAGMKLDDSDRTHLLQQVKAAVIRSDALGDAMRKLLQARHEVAATMTSQAILDDAKEATRGRN